MRALPILLLAACGWNDLPRGDSAWYDQPLWSPSEVVATADGLYAPMPRAGGLALVRQDGTSSRVDLGDARVVAVVPSPDGARVLTLVERYRCELDGPREARGVDLVRECPSGKLSTSTDAVIVDAGEEVARIALPGPADAVTWSDDGARAIALIDPGRAASISGVVNLNAVTVIDVAAGDATPVTVGFAASRVLFTPEGDRALVLSQSAVAVVDLSADVPFTDVTFPLTLDPDQVVTPVGVDLTPDGEHALISVAGAADLYVLDLVSPSINLLSLSGAPAAMLVDDVTDQTVLVYAGRAAVDLVDHQFFDVRTLTLDQGTNHIVPGDGHALLYSDTAGADVYDLDLRAADVTEYRLQATPLSVHLAPGERYAVALTTESSFGGRPGLEVLDLERGKASPLLLEGRGVGVAFSEIETSGTVTALNALVLQANHDYLYQLDLLTGLPAQIDLPRPPVGIGALADGTFFVTHDAPLGLVSFLDPVSGDVVEASGFGTFGMLEELALDSVEVK